MKSRSFPWLLLSLLAALAAPALAAEDAPVLGLIVKTKPAAHGSREGPLAARNRVEAIAQRRGVGYHKLRETALGAHVLSTGHVMPREDADRLARALAQDTDVEWVALNTLERRMAIPNDPAFGTQWWLQSRTSDRPAVPDFPAAWDVTQGGEVVVAVLDSGIRPGHPEFMGGSRLLEGFNFVTESVYANGRTGPSPGAEDPGDWVTEEEINTKPEFSGCLVTNSTWHGTVIAGQIAARSDDNFGIAGITWRGPTLLPVRVAGKCGAAVSDIIEGMLWAAGISYVGSPFPLNPNPARIINLSFGGDAPCDPNDPRASVAGNARFYLEAIRALKAKGAVLVAAAGNEGEGVVRPASCEGALAVAALSRSGAKAGYSNTGTKVGISTVGGTEGDGLYSTSNAGRQGPGADIWDYYQGTSFAAPLVSGTAALMLSVRPDLSTEQIIQGLTETALSHVAIPSLPQCSATSPNRSECNCTKDTCGAGVLDAGRAVAWARDTPGTYAPPVGVVTSTFIPERIRTSGSSGGGAASLEGLIGLAFAAAALSVRRRR